MTGVTIAEPSSLAEACGLVRVGEGEAKFLGGGSALVLLLKLGLVQPDVLVSLRGLADVPGWSSIEARDGRLVIGGGTSLTQVADSPLVRRHAPSLAHAASVVGNVRIRNIATMGGALAEADYAADLPAVLVSLGAAAGISDGTASRFLPVEELITDFFTTELAPDEVITEVTLPVAPPGGSSVYLKFSSRSAEDRPCVGVAASAVFDADRALGSLRLVVGAVAGTPQHFPQVTDPYVGAELGERDIADIASAYSETVDPIDDARGSAWYRREVVRAQVRRALDRVVADQRRR